MLITHVMTWSHIDLVLEVDGHCISNFKICVLIAMNDWDLLLTRCENMLMILR